MSQVEVWLPRSELNGIMREAERTFPDETGGVLLGYRAAEDNSLIQIMFATGPGPLAIHEPSRFEPDSKWQEAEIDQLYQRSGRIATYLGDWHSHPRGSTQPSKLDRSTVRRMARHSPARVPRPLMLILAGSPDRWAPAAHTWKRWRLRPAQVTVGATPPWDGIST